MISNNKFLKFLALLPILYILTVLTINYIPILKNIACKYTDLESNLGKQKVSSKIKAQININAKKLSISQKDFKIRKMGVAALQTYGYANAIACNPLLFKIIPIKQHYLYISDGLMEDLSKEEQDFIMGHELIHIKENHVFNIQFFKILILLIGVFVFFALEKSFFVNTKHPAFFSIFTALAMIILIHLINLTYSRHNERIADYESIKYLKTYDGALKFIDRLKNSFGTKDPKFNLFSSHPSFFERKNYCKKLKLKHKGKINEKI